ncbi:dTDP-4-dehydrorhamnose reductase [Aquimarina pacifica]|uniref:dTDP-4-dehydrorhamnose reductase n=1 Tax=Aquimarina pacifica TaxID=1296415 RepID=UPI0004B647FE|nr:dTDP-4-dehydrorhamnose reductase [Aquimarina pacifica]
MNENLTKIKQIISEKDMVRVVIIGASGQLGQCIKNVHKKYGKLEIISTTSQDVDITNSQEVNNFFEKKHFDYIINCAAYTNVEQAEKESEKAFLVNAEGVKNLAEVCKNYDATLIHISTDYVFDGKKHTPYTEKDRTNPINEYGKSKLKGEEHIQYILDKYFILRTSWLYSEFGHNFYKTILKKSQTEKELTITTSEIGTPTNANDLAKFILDLIESARQEYGLYHYSNFGEASWYDFAKEILTVSGKHEAIMLKKTDNYPTFAKRPVYSVLNKENTTRLFGLTILDWKESLRKLIIESPDK